ncbi:hypothetical protein BDV97DRAFT_345828 [Delphinella strobiligena]|nr:hypothetical protein BDV97DRAFT_345828 [Delphinella strobiligena]
MHIYITPPCPPTWNMPIMHLNNSSNSKNNLNKFWKTPTASIQKDDYKMAFYAPLNLATVNFPEFEWKWHTPGPFAHWTEDPWTNNFHMPKPIPGRQKARTPVFDVRETDEAFYFDGEFPGVRSKEDIKPRWINKRTLVIEATLTKVDLEKEWNIRLSEPEPEHHDDKDAPARDSLVDDCDNDLKLHRCLTNDDSDSTHSATTSPKKPISNTTRNSNNSSSSQNPPTSRRPSLEGFKKRLSWTAKKAQPAAAAPTIRHLASERNTGTFSRTFTFPEDVLHASLAAKLHHGLLTMIIFKKAPMVPLPVAIQVGTKPDHFSSSDKKDSRGLGCPTGVGAPGQDRDRKIRFE